MKTNSLSIRSKKAFTLLEMTIVIMVLLALVGMGLFSSSKMNEWKLARSASETLREVYSAQRMFLADNPTTLVFSLTDEKLIPYLPNRNPGAVPPVSLVAAFPPIRALAGDNLTFDITVSPPFLKQDGVRYDPTTPQNFNDSLWDIGG